MTRSIPILAALAIAASALHAADEPYKDFAEDVKLLRDTTLVPSQGKQVRFSSGKAQDASKRIFSKVAFLFKTREEVLDLLGDPATISDGGMKAEEGKNAPLVYRFDSGFGGPIYTLTFNDGKVTGIQVSYAE